jgi:hypothetical protein
MNNDSDDKIKKLHDDPELPSMYWVFSIVLFIVFLVDRSIPEGIFTITYRLLIFLFIVLCIVSRFAYRCYKNKKKLYIAYTEMEKRAKSQSALREQAENELEQLKHDYTLLFTVEDISLVRKLKNSIKEIPDGKH